MAADKSFDVVSKEEIQEVKNAIDQATKEVNARFDLKNSKSTIALEKDEHIQLASQDEYTLKAVIEILSQKLVKRGVSLKALEYEKLEPASNSSVRQKIKLIQVLRLVKLPMLFKDIRLVKEVQPIQLLRTVKLLMHFKEIRPLKLLPLTYTICWALRVWRRVAD